MSVLYIFWILVLCWRCNLEMFSPSHSLSFHPIHMGFFGESLNFNELQPGWVAQLVGASSCTPESCRFSSLPRRIPRPWVQSLVWACAGGNQLMLLSYTSVSLSLSVPPPTFLLSLKSITYAH